MIPPIRNAMTVDVEDYLPGPGVRRLHRPRRLGRHRPARGAQRRSHSGPVRCRRRDRHVLHAGLDRRTPQVDGPPHRRRRPRTGQPRLRPHPRRCPGSGRRSVPMLGARAACWKISAACAVRGYRAATFSIGARNQWAFGALEDEATTTVPASTRSATICTACRTHRACPIVPAAGGLWEIPMTTVRAFGPQFALLRRRLFPPVARTRCFAPA